MTKPATPLPLLMVHSGEDYTVLLGPDDTTDTAVARVRSDAEAIALSYRANAYLSLVEDNKRLREALRELLNAVNPMPGKGVCVMDGDRFVDQARALLVKLGEAA